MPPPLDFPEHGSPEADVLAEVEARMSKDPYPVERNFGVSYVGPPHDITESIRPLAAGSFFVEWARDMNPGADLFEKEAVRMLGSLLGHREAVGFITSGGTESNLLALRLARNIGAKSEPEVVLPTTAHYSFRLGAELLGLRLREVDVDDAMRPDMRQVERLLNANTVALVCSAPEGNYGQLDPVEEFADLAQRKGLYLHVDAAFGGFALPFLRELGYPIPPFDFSLPGVSSMMTDGHKLGLLPVATGFFLIRDEAMLDAIPAEFTGIHTITATKPGDHAVAAWSVMRRLGREGYRESARRLMEVVDIISKGIETSTASACSSALCSPSSTSPPIATTWNVSTWNCAAAAGAQPTATTAPRAASASPSTPTATSNTPTAGSPPSENPSRPYALDLKRQRGVHDCLVDAPRREPSASGYSPMARPAALAPAPAPPCAPA